MAKSSPDNAPRPSLPRPPALSPKLQALLLAALVLAMVIIAIASGGHRWAALRPRIKSHTLEIARRLKPIEAELKRRDEAVRELTGAGK